MVSILDLEQIRATVTAALKSPPARDDPRFDIARGGRVGSPALVYTPDGGLAYWLVPLIVEDLACGLAQVDLTGKVTRLGILGGSPTDRASWIDPGFFRAPPRSVMAEIGAAHEDALVGKPVLSYDASPTRWAWRIEISEEGRVVTVVFVTPGGWYRRPPVAFQPDREG